MTTNSLQSSRIRCKARLFRARLDSGLFLSTAFLLAATSTFAAAGEPTAPQDRSRLLGIGVLAASGVGSMSSDLNGHPGFGIVLQGYLPVTRKADLRPAFEWTGYRVNGYNLAARLLAETLGASYEETRVVFRTYRLGLDWVGYLRDRGHGPYLSGGAGLQISRMYIEDVVRSSDRGTDITPLDASSATTGLWLGLGVGRAWPGATAEVRLSRAPYRFTEQRNTDPRSDAIPLEPRPGWALHLLLAVRFPV